MKKEEIKKELQLIAEKNGGTLRPVDVVEFAKNPKTALHDCFTWDDSEAAHQWRLHQARMIIRVIVNVIPYDDEEREYRAYVSLVQDRHAGIGYRPIISVLQDEYLREQLLEDALNELKVFQEKYKTVQELFELFSVINRLEAKYKKPKQKETRRMEARV